MINQVLYSPVLVKGRVSKQLTVYDYIDLYSFFSFSFLFIYSLSALQVLSMSRLGGAGAVAPLVTDIPLSSVEVINMNIIWYLNISLLIFLPL